MIFEPKKEYVVAVEKRNTIGLWTRKVLVFKDLVIGLCDSEKDKKSLVAKFVVSAAVQSADDNAIVTFSGTRDELVVRFSSASDADSWVRLCTAALALLRQTRARFGLPVVDPRNGLRFCEVPQEYSAKFVSLEKSVLYWFSPVKKFGTPSKFTRKHSTEERVGFCSDKAFYLTKPNSEITRCIRLSKIKFVTTNSDTSNEEKFLAIHVHEPDYDLCFSAPTCEQLIHCIAELIAHSGQTLIVKHAKSVGEVSDLRLERPTGYTMTLLVPTAKDQLKKALDEYAKKHGIRFTDNGVQAKPVSDSPGGVCGSDCGNGSFTADHNAADPMACFLRLLGCSRYFMSLYKQNVDMDILECMDETDLRTYGISDDAHIKLILGAVQDATLREKVRLEVSQGRSTWSSSAIAVPRLSSPLSTVVQQKVELDLSDDDIIVEKTSPAGVLPIALDSDDDLDMPPKPVKPVIVLDDDDL